MSEARLVALLLCAAAAAACGGGDPGGVDNPGSGGAGTTGTGLAGSGVAGLATAGNSHPGATGGAGGVDNSNDANETSDGPRAPRDSGFSDVSSASDATEITIDSEPVADAMDLEATADDGGAAAGDAIGVIDDVVVSVLDDATIDTAPAQDASTTDTSVGTPDASAIDAGVTAACDPTRYVTVGLGVRDMQTGLEWQRWSSDGPFDLATATTFCSSAGWRLPTRAELEALRGPSGTGGACPLDPCAFLGNRCAIFAAGPGEGLNGDGLAWAVDLMTGGSVLAGGGLAVRCVR